MPTENDIILAHKAMAFDLVQIFKADPEKTYTPDELEKLLVAYVKGLEEA